MQTRTRRGLHSESSRFIVVHRNSTVSAGIALSMTAFMLLRQRKPISLRDKTVFVTRGSRGVELLLVGEFASRGAKIAISAREPKRTRTS
jgi:hypothetical protein